jgi:ABC-type nitrate/sulfonate/bicarbonate transport system substrate-binding protein
MEIQAGAAVCFRRLCFMKNVLWPVAYLLSIVLFPLGARAADKLVGIHSARTMSQSMPWIAEEVGLFKKYDLDFQLVYISSASLVTAAMLSGDGDVAITGGESIHASLHSGGYRIDFYRQREEYPDPQHFGKAGNQTA